MSRMSHDAAPYVLTAFFAVDESNSLRWRSAFSFSMIEAIVPSTFSFACFSFICCRASDASRFLALH